MRTKVTNILNDEGPAGPVVEKRVYVARFDVMTLAPFGLQQPDFSIHNVTRRAYLKRVIWNMRIINQTLNSVHNLHTNVAINYNVTIFALAGIQRPLGLPFNAILPPAPSVANMSIEIFEPGQYTFEGIYFQEDMAFSMDIVSLDAVNTYLIYTNLTAEVEQIF
jgi:hypothetical protein